MPVPEGVITSTETFSLIAEEICDGCSEDCACSEKDK